MGCVQVVPLTSRTPSIGVGYNSVFHDFLPWCMSVITYFHHMVYLLELDNISEVYEVVWDAIGTLQNRI